MRIIWYLRINLVQMSLGISGFIFAQHGDVLINNFPLKFGKIVVIKVSAPALYEMVLWSLIVQIIVCSLIKMR